MAEVKKKHSIWLANDQHRSGTTFVLQDYEVSKYNLKIIKVNALIESNCQLIHGSSAARQSISHEKSPNNETANCVLKYRCDNRHRQSKLNENNCNYDNLCKQGLLKE